MKLYFVPGTCSRAPHIVLHELGVPFESEKLDPKNKSVKEGDYLKINPKGHVPALKMDNGQILTETAVICQYLADQKPEMNLIPKAGTLERYRLMEWMNFIATELHKGMGPLWLPQLPTELRDMFTKRVEAKLQFLSDSLGSQNFLMGNQYTVADAYLFTVLGWTKKLHLDLSKYPRLLAHSERMEKRPAVQETGKKESEGKNMAQILFLLMGSLLIGASQFAEAWTVVALKGSEISAERNGVAVELKIGGEVQIGTLLTTGRSSKIKLVEGKSILIIADKSRTLLGAGADDPSKPSPTVPMVNLQVGKLRVQLDKPEALKYKFSIPSVVAGARGTEFFMSASVEKEVICVLEGKVDATEVKTKNKATVSKGIGWIREGTQAPKLVTVSDQQKKDWISATSL